VWNELDLNSILFLTDVNIIVGFCIDSIH
jgi:hypothetical protein